jgi:hypothetical protein
MLIHLIFCNAFGKNPPSRASPSPNALPPSLKYVWWIFAEGDKIKKNYDDVVKRGGRPTKNLLTRLILRQDITVVEPQAPTPINCEDVIGLDKLNRQTSTTQLPNRYDQIT